MRTFILSIIIVFLVSLPALADEKPNLTEAGTASYSAANAARVVLNEDKQTFTVSARYKGSYTSSLPNPALQLGKLYITDNGRYVTWILSEPFFSKYCPAKPAKDGKKEVIKDVKWEELPAMLFYRDGVLRRRYLLSDFIKDEKLLKCSEVNISWLKSQPIYDSRSNSLQFETAASLWYNFSPETGDVFWVRRTQ